MATYAAVTAGTYQPRITHMAPRSWVSRPVSTAMRPTLAKSPRPTIVSNHATGMPALLRLTGWRAVDRAAVLGGAESRYAAVLARLRRDAFAAGVEFDASALDPQPDLVGADLV